MKRTLLLSFALIMGLFSSAQNLTPMAAPPMKMNEGMNQLIEAQGVIGVKPAGTTSGSKAISIAPFSSSLNMFTVIGSGQVCLSVIPATKTIGFFHREGGSYSNPSNLNAALRVKYTSNYGSTWDSLYIPGNTTHRFRYPSGALYNKSGNIIPGNIFAIYTGPNTNGSGFDSCYRGTAKLNGSSTLTKYAPYSGANTYINHMNESTSIGDDKYAHVFSTHYAGNQTNYYFDKWTVLNGLLDDNTGAMTWSAPVDITPGPAAFAGGGFYSSGMAWSQNGAIGYFYTMAKDSSNAGNRAAQPVIWKSTDHGATWTGPTYFDFSTISGMGNIIWHFKNNQSSFEPFFSAGDNSSGAVVDLNGNLHIFAIVKGLYTPWTQDSSGITFKYEPLHLVDVFTTGSGWGVKHITDLYTNSVLSTDAMAITTSGGSPIGWDHRIQASRTLDGNNLFCAWADQSDSAYLDFSTYSVSVPDIFVWGYDITNAYFTPVVNVTKYTLLDAAAYFHFLGDKAIHDGTDFVLPLTSTMFNNQSADDPCIHYYISGVKLSESDFTTGTTENKLAGGNIEVSPNYPNPFSGTTRISVKTSVTSQLSLEVTDLLGKNVIEINKGKVNAGTYEFVINAGSLDPGIYFYTVQSGNERITRKMIAD